jgi:DNA primase
LAGLIPEDKISEIKNSVDIVEVISEVVFLKKAGNNYVGLCPFHSEKTPSFTVNPDKQIFYCFGCGVGGNVYTFLMKQDGLSFVEAVRQLARRYGISIPDQRSSPESQKKYREKEQLFAINKAAMEFFQDCLKRPDGRKARDYLKNRRIHQETIDLFRLGFVPDGWDNLVRFSSKQKSALQLVEKAGLIVSRPSKNGYYDRFRNRIMFPIFNQRQQVIGFGGRVMDDSLPKYLNSPETSIFNKSTSLYGLNIARQVCRETGTVYLVEGYFDMISLYQAGIKNVVATLGTSLTSAHVRLLKGIARKVVLVFDSDSAGIKAAQRGVSLFMQEAVGAKVMILPQGYDPDTYINEFGRTSFSEITDNALEIIPFLIESAIDRHGFSVEGKLSVVNDLKEPIRSIANPVARSLYVKELAERIEVDEKVILNAVKTTALKKNTTGGKSVPVSDRKPLQGQKRQEFFLNGQSKAESKIIAMMLQRPKMVADIIENNVLAYFENKTLKTIGETVIQHQNPDSPEPVEIFSYLDTEKERSLAAALSMDDEDCWDDNGCRKLIFQFVSVVRNRNVRALSQKIKAAEERNDLQLVQTLLEEKQKIARKNQKQKMLILKSII